MSSAAVMINALRVKSISHLLVAGKTEYHINPIKCPGGVAFHGREALFIASGVNQSLPVTSNKQY